jgi:3-hydroxybutyryl-CoA dehydrogenase
MNIFLFYESRNYNFIMKENQKKFPILVKANHKLAYSISICLLQAGHPVTVLTENISGAQAAIDAYLEDLAIYKNYRFDRVDLLLIEDFDNSMDYELAIAVTDENLPDKRATIALLEKNLSANCLIAINTESISLMNLQEYSINPERIIGANWADPAHTTQFLELISNDKNNKEKVDILFELAKSSWKKDPYIITCESSIRSRLFCSMAREAFYLVENGYASVEDIDRACRNDPGYYLPFAGNFRYIDLMGTAGYGIVMEDLNPELSKAKSTPDFFKEIIEQGGLGMGNKKGFYTYNAEEVQKFDEQSRQFSYQIEQIISKYPFNYMKENSNGGSMNGDL